MSSENQPLVGNERRLALVIGVNEAPQSHLDPLNYAINDAEAMAHTLEEHCGFTLLMPPLLGQDATSANVKRAVLALARQRTDDDFLLLYFSGHGQPMTISGDQSDIYLVTSDFSETDTEADDTLHCSMKWLQDKLYIPTQAGKVLLVLDCCYAGNMGRTAADPYLEDLKARINKYFGSPGAASGARAGGLRQALTATGHNQPAYEQDGHGIMTGLLLKCLRGDVDDVIDLNDHGNVNLQYVQTYLHRMMPEDQKPSVSGDDAGRKCILANYEQRARELLQHRQATINEIPHTYLPQAHLTAFQQRPGEFDEIATLLFTGKGGEATPQSNIVGLIGMGGIGKTRLAVEIADAYRERFAAGIFWMAATGTTLSEWQHQFAELAANTEYLPLGDDITHPENEARRARHISRYLAHHSDALLLLDNVESIEHLLDTLTMLAGEEVHCTIIYTSRNDVAPPAVKKYDMRKLPEAGALHLLLERRSTLAQILSDADNQEIRAARDICHYIDYLPLALILLRDLLQDTHLTLTYLNQQLRTRGALEITRDADVTDARLFSTILLSWQQVHNPGAQRLFKLASLFPEATSIPLWLLATAANLEGNTSIEPLGKARLDLLHRSLIEELPGDMIRLHPIIREFARHLLAQDSNRDDLQEAAGVHITGQFANISKLEQKALAEGYWACLEQVQETVSYTRQLNGQQAALLERIAYWLARDGSLLGADSLWPKVLPGLFYQQLHNRSLEEDYQLAGTATDTRWVRQLAPVGAEDQSLLREFRHPAGVTCVAFSPDGNLVATGCEDGMVRIWDADSGQILQIVSDHTSPITGVAFSPDGSTIITTSLATGALLWNVLTGQVTGVFGEPRYELDDVAFSPDGKYIAARSEHKFVRIWDVVTGEMAAVIVERSGWIGGFAFSSDSKQITTLSSEQIEIWGCESGERLAASPAYGKAEEWWGIQKIEHLSIAFSIDGKSVLFGSQYGIHRWTIGEQEVSAHSYTDRFPTHHVTATAFSSNRKQLAIVRDTTVEISQIQNEQPRLALGHNTTVTSVAFSQDGTKLVTGSSDGMVRIRKIYPLPITKTAIKPIFEEIKDAAFSSAGIHLLTAGTTQGIATGRNVSNEGVLRVWDVRDGQLVRTLQSDSKEISYMAFSPDREKIAMGAHNAIKIWNIGKSWDEKEQQKITRAPFPIYSSFYSMSDIAFSFHGLHVATGFHQTVQVWNLDTGEKRALLRGHEGPIEHIAFSPDDRKLVTGATDGTARIWQLSKSKQLAVLKNYAGKRFAISLDSHMLAVGLFSNAIYVASMEDGARLAILEGHTQLATMLSFSPTGRLLLSADQSGLVLFWRVNVDGQATKTPLGIYLATNEIGAVHWQDEQHVTLADLGGMQNHPHFYHLALEGIW